MTERIFAGPRTRKLLATVEAGLERVETRLGDELTVSDALVDAKTRYLYEAGGKRLRPMLALLTAQLGDGATEDVIAGAAALELTHLGSLYHDDVMDGADKRRGVPSAHEVWGNNVAILTGDLLFSRASQLMARIGERAIRVQADTFERLVLGQMHETIGAQPGDDPVEFYIQVLADKTGSLIAAAAQVGVLFSGGPEELAEPLLAFGEKAGVAFQLLDDVIDLSADPEATGKVPGTDLRAGVPTMPYLLLTRADDEASRELAATIDRGVAEIAEGADPAILDEPLARLRDHAVTAETRRLAEKWADDAVAALAPLPSGAVRDALTRFAEVVVDRAS
ncbi:geranylgeranyl pyrophosphate synthase [Microbacterium sp. AISO3]|jgi:heptaprenyl diphosphate synthase|nr:geranylgeranyl pyrophosphate synthase [Microbacterium paludicola]OAZ40986.1 geranylgeranyl pyrophosphate synthase [Microbacterium arborescens]OWP21947.1 geranylgeranyl pyrophosphate synthase [Microbacterium sp. AISO3]POX67685.1 polyprenyl synthetase family protein [Microbacterium sp. Ru50]QCR39650.1 polyprenyl synthetase family protein [Microbacterium sp. SGAir0570]GAD33754.1 geranylgeranyl pyrophosphate synthase [Microbacterium sp. TS-1]